MRHLFEYQQQSADAIIAQKRAEIAAKVAAMKKSAFGVSSTVSPTSIKPVHPSPSPANADSPDSGSPAVTDDLSRRVLEARRRVAEAQSKLAVKDNPYMVRHACNLDPGINQLCGQSMPQTGKKNRPAEPSQQGAGLKMAAHPLLLDNTPTVPQSKKDRYKPMQPKFASIKVSSHVHTLCANASHIFHPLNIIG
jgi:U4/U6 small nuclear ribonucleoprotein PRP3